MTEPYDTFRSVTSALIDTYAVLRTQRERAGPLLEEVEQLAGAARQLLERVGLEYLVDATLGEEQGLRSGRSRSEEIAATYAASRVTWSDFMADLERLGLAWANQGDIQRCDEVAARLAALGADERARALQRAATVGRARAAIEVGAWEEARRQLQPVLAENAERNEGSELLYESYYREAQSALDSQQWQLGANALRSLFDLTPDYRDAADWLEKYPLLAWSVGPLTTIAEIDIGRGLRSSSQAAFSPDSRILAVATEVAVRTWDATTGQLVRSYPQPVDEPRSIAFSPDGRHLAVGGKHSARVWSVETGQVVHTVSPEVTYVTENSGGRLEQRPDYVWFQCVGFWPDGKAIAVGDSHASLTVGEFRAGGTERVLERCDEFPRDFALSARGELLAATVWGQHLEGRIVLWDVATGRRLQTFETQMQCLRSVAFSSDGRRIVAGGAAWGSSCDRGMAEVWDVQAGVLLHTLHISDAGAVWRVAFGPWPGSFMTLCSPGTIRMWRTETGQCLGAIPIVERDGDALTDPGRTSFSQDGRHLVVISRPKGSWSDSALLLHPRRSSRGSVAP